jgi:TP901 family phage tail tape measure protein
MAEELTIKVGADVAQALSGLGQVHGKVSDLGSAATTSGGGLSSLVNPLTVAAAGVGLLGAGLVDSIGKAGKFDQGMAQIRATMQPTGAEMDKLRGLALDLGKATDVGSVSAQDASDAIFELGKAGISADQQLAGVTKSTLQLAAAAGPEFGVAKSAELAADSLNSFGLKAGDAKGVVNTLVGAANASSIGLEDLKYSLSAVGSVAHTVGLNFQDTATAIAILGANGLKGSDAGTSLKSVLMNLQPHTKATIAEMKELGIVTKDGANKFFDAQGHVKKLADVADILQTSLKGMTDQQKFSTLQTLFGSDGIRAASIIMREGKTGVDEMAGSMAQQGDAAKVAADMNNNFNGKMEALKGTIETVQIAIGSTLTPVLGFLADQANNLIGGALTQLPVLFDQIGAAIQQVTPYAQMVLGVFQSFGEFLGGVFTGKLTQVIAGLDGIPVGLQPIALGIAQVFALIQTTVQTVTAQVSGIIQSVTAIWVTFFQQNGASIMATVTSVWNSIVSITQSVWGIVSQVITTVLSIIQDFIKAHSTEIQAILKTAWETIQIVIKGALDVIQNFVIPILKGIAQFISDHATTIKAVLDAAWTVISSIITGALNVIQGVVKTVTGLIHGDWKTVWEGIQQIVGGVWTAIQGIVQGGLNLLASGMLLVEQAVQGAWEGAWGAIKGFVETTWTTITTFLGGLPAKAMALMGSVGQGLINGIINGLAGLGKQMYDSITGMIGGAVQDVKNFFGIKSPSTYTSEHLGNPLGSGIAKGILMAEGEITKAFQDTVGNSVLAVKKAIASDNTIDDVLQHTTSSLKDAQAAWDAFIKAVGAGLGVGGGEGTDSTAASDGEVMNGMLDALNENFNSTARDMQGKAIPAFDELAKSAKALADGLGAAAKSMGDKTNPDGLVYNWNKGLDDMFAHSNNAWIPQTKAIFKVFFNDMTGYFRDYTKDWVQYWQDAMGAMTAPPLPAGAGGGGQQGVGHIGGGSGGGTTNVHVYLDGEELSHALRTVSAIRNDL